MKLLRQTQTIGRLAQLVLVGLGAVAAGGVLWRLGSQRQELPCPSRLRWKLDMPYGRQLAGVEAILERLALAPGMAVADVGCGPGRLLVPIAQRVGPQGRVVGLDIQGEMVRLARAEVATAGLDNVQLIHGGAGEGLLEANAFDRVLLVSVLGEIPQREAALREIHGALAPGGMLSISETFPGPHYQPRRTVRRLALAAGFQEQRAYGSWLAFTLNFSKPAGSKQEVGHA